MAENNPTPLLTALLIHYQNGVTIFETIDSILAQDYPRIELVVSDDDSDNFDTQKVRDYIESNKGDNIERVVVRRNEHNLGTVAHLEAVRKITSGDIELLIAADDCWCDPRVFSDFAQAFADFGPDAEFVTSQIEMCDERLNSTGDLFITPYIRQLLLNEDMESLLNEVALSCVLPGPGSAFRRSYFEKIGSLANDYTIVEDWSAHLRWLRMGYKINYIDRVTLKHRHGGISHSVSAGWPSHYLQYRKDMEHVFEVEVAPFEDRFNPEIFEKAYDYFKLNRARRLSLENVVSLLLVYDGRSSECADALKSAFAQNAMNFELLIGCRTEDVDSLINKTNTKYLASPSLNRIRIIERQYGESEASLLRRLAENAHSTYLIKVGAGKRLASAYSALSYLSKELTGESFAQAPKTILSETKKRTRKKNKLRSKVVSSRRLRDFSKPRSMQVDLMYASLIVVVMCCLGDGVFFQNPILKVALLAMLAVVLCLATLRAMVFVARKILE